MTPFRAGTREFMQSKGVTAYANVPRDFVLRAMASDQCLDARLRHAMILWSWCGPEASEAVVRKKPDGFIVRNPDGKPIPAQFKDLVELLGLAPGMKGHVSRIAQGMVMQGLLRMEGKTMHLVYCPAAFDTGSPVASTGNWSIAGVVVSTGNLPVDPEARAAAIRFLEVASTLWKNDLRDVKTRNRELLRQGLAEHGIGIGVKSKKSSREEKSAAAPFPAPEPLYKETPSSSSSVSSEPTTTKGTANVNLTPPRTDAVTVLGTMGGYGLGDLKAVEDVLKEIAAIAPDADVSDVCRFVHEKAPLTLRKGKGTAYLCAAVRNAFTGHWRIAATPIDAPTDEEIARALADREELEKAFAAEMNKPL